MAKARRNPPAPQPDQSRSMAIPQDSTAANPGGDEPAPEEEPEVSPAPEGETVDLEPDSSDASAPEAEDQPGLSLPDPAKPAPRASKADAFEQNPLSAVPHAAPLSRSELDQLDDGTRVREALRSVIEQGDSVKEAAREWHVAPSSIAEWRARYQDLLNQQPATPLMEDYVLPADAGLTYIPEAAREIFTENWDRLVTETEATAADFQQSPTQIFLQTSPVTAWLFPDGQLDRGILTGVASVIVGLGLLVSFLMADHKIPDAAALPEPAPRDDLVIGEAAAVAQSFFAAPTWQERLEFVRQPEAVRGMMEAYYKEFPDGPISDAALTLAWPSRHVVNLSFDIPSRNRSHFLCVVQSKGRYVVDWESSSLYQETLLARLREARSPEPTRIAVTVRKETAKEYYNYFFSDAQQWVCYQLGYPGLNLNLFGYARADSSDALTLDAMLGIVDQHAVVMEVRFPPGAVSNNQVEIVNVLRNEWVPDDL